MLSQSSNWRIWIIWSIENKSNAHTSTWVAILTSQRWVEMLSFEKSIKIKVGSGQKVNEVKKVLLADGAT